jgi:hypothetical protein
VSDNPLATIKIDDMKGQVADQLRAFMMTLIPKEAFDKVVEASWERLTKPRRMNKGNEYHPNWVELPSELDEMVTAEMRTQMLAKVKEWSVKWRETYDAEQGAKQVLAELVNQAAGAFIHNAARGIVDLAVNNALDAHDEIRMNCGSCYQPTRTNSTCRCGFYNSK